MTREEHARVSLKIRFGEIKVNNRSPLEHRFWVRVNRFGPVHPVLGTRCWLWTGPRMKSGYGMFRQLAHRMSYIFHCGPIPQGLSVLHKCDTPPCVNPDHLFTGTQQDNLADMRAKGRQVIPVGEARHPKVNETIVREMRKRYKPYDRKDGAGAMAKEFGISQCQAWGIVTGVKWRHVQ